MKSELTKPCSSFSRASEFHRKQPHRDADMAQYMAHGARATQFLGSVDVQRSTVHSEPGQMGLV